MLEWMHDSFVVRNLKCNFGSKTISDCEKFINDSYTDKKNLHLAIDLNGEYMGTVSLKNIEKGRAEFAIVIRKSAMGKGISKYAMEEIIRIGFYELNLNLIYWYVDPVNERAIRFYDKNNYKRITSDFLTEEKNDSCNQKEVKQYVWYKVNRKNEQKEDVL